MLDRFCFIAASWIWIGLEEKITVKLTKSRIGGLKSEVQQHMKLRPK
jgi:hypothetical protein